MGHVCRLHREVEYVSGERAGTCTSEWAYALTSLTLKRADPARRLQVWWGHWQIENGLHWVRGATLGEDANQTRCGQAPAVFIAIGNTTLGRIQLAEQTNVAAAQRRYAMDPAEVLVLLGITYRLLE